MQSFVFSNNLSNRPFQPHAPSVFHAQTNRKMIVETATTIIGRGKIDKVFSRQIITQTQTKTTEACILPKWSVLRRILPISA
jgi:hypothetical protein